MIIVLGEERAAPLQSRPDGRIEVVEPLHECAHTAIGIIPDAGTDRHGREGVATDAERADRCAARVAIVLPVTQFVVHIERAGREIDRARSLLLDPPPL